MSILRVVFSVWVYGQIYDQLYGTSLQEKFAIEFIR